MNMFAVYPCEQYHSIAKLQQEERHGCNHTSVLQVAFLLVLPPDYTCLTH